MRKKWFTPVLCFLAGQSVAVSVMAHADLALPLVAFCGRWPSCLIIWNKGNFHTETETIGTGSDEATARTGEPKLGFVGFVRQTSDVEAGFTVCVTNSA